MATISLLVEGGAATMAPPNGPAIAGSGANPGKVIAEINAQTKSYAGMTVPIKLTVDSKTKEFHIEVGVPPTSSLIKGELGLKEPVREEAGSKGNKNLGNLTFAQLLKVAEMKGTNTLAKSLKAKVREIVGTCVSLGVTVEGKNAKEFQKEIANGKWDSKLQ